VHRAVGGQIAIDEAVVHAVEEVVVVCRGDRDERADGEVRHGRDNSDA
jgi:lipopolysaccharide biosynthesis protein